jgi:hypothetical protein
MDFANITALESIRTGPLVYTRGGERFVLPDPVDMTVEDILHALYAGTLRELPLDMTPRQTDAVFRQWAARHDLPTIQNAQRLVYTVGKFRREVEYDLLHEVGADLTALWQARRWGHLLSLIDHLPRTSWYTEATSNDQEHAAMIAKAIAERGDSDEAYHPPLRMWSQEAALLAEAIDAIRNVSATLVGVNGGKPSQPTPVARPTTELERAQKDAVQNRKKARHDRLVARMLPHKANPDD